MVLTGRTRMPLLNLEWKVFGRPVKPVSFALMGSMFTILVTNILDQGVLDGSEAGDVLGGMGGTVGVMFALAWLMRSQQLNEYALLGAGFVWGLRFWAIIFVNRSPLTSEGLYMSVFWLILALGSFALEVSESHGVEGRRWTRQ